LVAAALVAASIWGRARTLPDLEPYVLDLFGEDALIGESSGLLSVHNEAGALLGWAAAGEANGYGGPLLIVSAVDTSGNMIGACIVEHRETPVFYRMVRSTDYFESAAGIPFTDINYDYREVVGVTGATRSADAIVAGLRESVRRMAGPAFGMPMPPPARPFEFGILELVVLLLFAAAITVHRRPAPIRQPVRWATQITGLVVIGFWKDSPVTLSRITGLLAGYFPDPHTNLAFYFLILGFALTSLLTQRNLYCLYACPFGATQRCVGAISGKSFPLPAWSMKVMGRVRNLVVFLAMMAALITMQPTLVSYEPFAAIFSLRGTMLQWFLLLIVLVSSLMIRLPWCTLFCPMRSIELALQSIRRSAGRLVRRNAHA
jgi:hypothetical protein